MNSPGRLLNDATPSGLPKSPDSPDPALVLLDPRWMVALGVLALNDHVLKGSALNGLLTGKLSDVAGLIVAPALLCMLCRCTRRGTMALAHALIGAVFVSIQLAPTVAAGWDAAMSAVGFAWVTTSDPTDVLMLPALLMSWRILNEPRPIRVSQRRLVRSSLAGAGLILCAATGDPNPPDSDEDTGLTSGTEGGGIDRAEFNGRLEPVRVGSGEAPVFRVTACPDPEADTAEFEFEFTATLDEPASAGAPEIFIRVLDPAGASTTLTDGPNVDTAPRSFSLSSVSVGTHDPVALCDPGFEFTLERIDSEPDGAVLVELDASVVFGWSSQTAGDATVTIEEIAP